MDLPTGRNFEQTQRALILSRTPDAGKSPWKGRLLGGSKPTRGPFSAATDLGVTGFFLLLRDDRLLPDVVVLQLADALLTGCELIGKR
jgi:hypothetical protein